jgi:hypothetical protein
MFVSRDQHSEFPLPINSILGVAVSLLLKYILKEYDSKYLPRHEPFPRAPNQTPRKIRSGTSLDRSQDNVYVNTTFSQISTILNDFRERLELRHSNDTMSKFRKITLFFLFCVVLSLAAATGPNLEANTTGHAENEGEDKWNGSDTGDFGIEKLKDWSYYNYSSNK